jgi:alpha-N-arabinofuranosidase
MKKYFVYAVFVVFLLNGCKTGKENSAGEIIQNPSAEITEGSVVKGWTPEARARYAVHFYDNVAHSGKKSLFIDATRSSNGRWSTKVLLKPWSKYHFSGWVKTENLVSESGKGAGFRVDGMMTDSIGLKGTSGWKQVAFDFETGSNDCAILSCLLDVKSRAKGRVWFDDMKIEYLSSEKITTDVTVNTSEKAQAMPVYIYGQFIEHLGRCIYGGIWAEMLEDRKFWYVPGTRESPWRISGVQEMLSMNSYDPFTGAQTPVLSVDGEKKAILQQENLGLKENLDYNGRIILRSSGNIEKVTVTLKWDDKTEVTEIKGLNYKYTAYPLNFKSTGLVHDAILSVEPFGKGKVYVGTVSLMPGDNVEGFRSDVLALLRELNAPVYRWPGGNFVSGYNWRDGIGDRDKRPPRKNPAWQGVEANDVGIHEFMKFCELVNTEAYIAVNAGLGNSDEAMAEVQYTNGSADSPMGKIRMQNGHPKPWTVKFWSIGNEMYGDWQLGHMSTDQFVQKNNEFADKMKLADPSIKLISVGDLGAWDRMVLANCSDRMDYISEHFYKQDYHGGGLMTHINQIPDAIKEKAVAHRIYRDEIPALKGKDIRICMDEWNFWYGPHIYGELGTRYFYRDAMGIAAGLNEFSRNTDIIYMANYAQTVNVIGCIKTNTTHSTFDATGQVLKLYRKKFGFIPVKLEGETRPLNIAATLTAGGDTLTVSVVNPTGDPIAFPFAVNGSKAQAGAEIWKVSAPDVMSTNEPGQKPAVIIEGPEKLDFNGKLQVEPVSITIFRIPLTL